MTVDNAMPNIVKDFSKTPWVIFRTMYKSLNCEQWLSMGGWTGVSGVIQFFLFANFNLA